MQDLRNEHGPRICHNFGSVQEARTMATSRRSKSKECKDEVEEYEGARRKRNWHSEEEGGAEEEDEDEGR